MFKRYLIWSFAIAALPALAGVSSALTFSLEGTGRACGGRFAIDGAKIVWTTHFSKCSTRRAILLSQSADEKYKTYAYELSRSQKSCPYKFIAVKTPLAASQTIGWSVTGYETRQDMLDGREENALSCYLTQNTPLPLTAAQTAARSR